MSVLIVCRGDSVAVGSSAEGAEPRGGGPNDVLPGGGANFEVTSLRVDSSIA